MLDILKLVAPKEYELLDKSPVKISVSVGRIDQAFIKKDFVKHGITSVPPMTTTFRSLVDRDGKIETIGFKSSLKDAYDVDEQYTEQLNNTEDVSKLIDVSTDTANKMVKFDKSGFKVVIDETLPSDQLAKIGGHEFGHVYFGLANPAYSYVLDDSLIKDAVDGHVTNNQVNETHPNGKQAFRVAMLVESFRNLSDENKKIYDEAVKKYKTDLKAAKKKDKEEKNKN